MNTVEIKTGNHNAGFFDKFQTYWQSLTKKNQPVYLLFPNAARYTLDKGDQHDINKIIGRKGLIFKKEGNMFTLKTEQYLGWRYSPATDQVEVINYWRENFEFNYQVINRVKIGEVAGPYDISWFKSPLPGGAYFGGNRVVPENGYGRVVYHISSGEITQDFEIKNPLVK